MTGTSTQGARERIDFADLFAQLPSPYMILDTGLRFVDANSAYLEVTARRREDLIGRFVFDAFPEEPERRDRFEDAFRRAVAGEHNILERQEFRIARPDRDGGGLKSVIWTTHQIPVRDRGGEVVGMLQKALDVTSEVRAEQMRETVIEEFDHRLRNIFAKLGAITALTAREETELEPFLAKQRDRFEALARTQSLLSHAPADGVSLGELVCAELAPFGAGEAGSGREIRLNSSAAQALGMTLHELATNAAKHRALRDGNGSLKVGWRVLDGGNPELEVDWRETGFAAAEPSHSGVGTRIIERLLSAETGGAVERRFGDDGHRTLIRIPLDRALHPDA